MFDENDLYLQFKRDAFPLRERRTAWWIVALIILVFADLGISDARPIASFNVKADFQARGDGVTDDSASINRAISEVIRSGGGTLFFPRAPDCYITSDQLLIDLSSIERLFWGRIQIIGEGSASTCIKNTTLTGSGILKFQGSRSNPQSYFALEGIRLMNDGVTPPVNSIGLETRILAFAALRDVFLEGFDLAWDAYDTEQVGIYDSYIRYNNRGVRANAATRTTNPNSWSYFNTAVSNNYMWGILHNTGFSLYYAGGTIQGNGRPGCRDCWGISLQNLGYGAGAAFDSVDMEANTGIASIISNQTMSGGGTVTTFSLRNVTFQRNGDHFSTNDILIEGDLPAIYKISTSVFMAVNGYVATSDRPSLVILNPFAKIDDDGTNWFEPEQSPRYRPSQIVVRPTPSSD
jgi:Pectate lyase superfamily protein